MYSPRMKKFILFLSTVLWGHAVTAETLVTKENSIEMTQDGPANQAEISQQGTGNKVIIHQGGAMPALIGEDVIHLRPTSKKIRLHREKQEEAQRLRIHQHGGGKLEVKSITGDGKAVTEITASPSSSEH